MFFLIRFISSAVVGVGRSALKSNWQSQAFGHGVLPAGAIGNFHTSGTSSCFIFSKGSIWEKVSKGDSPLTK